MKSTDNALTHIYDFLWPVFHKEQYHTQSLYTRPYAMAAA
jgi:hypothetical protein